MNLSIKALLPLAILVSGSVSCTDNPSVNFIKTIEHAMHFEESLHMALEHPALLTYEKMENSVKSKDVMTFGDWIDFLHNGKEETKKMIKADAAYKYFRLSLNEEEFRKFTEFLNGDTDATTIVVNDDDDTTEEWVSKIYEDFKLKQMFLELIMNQLPIIKDIFSDKDLVDEDYDKILRSHIDAFIVNALEFDEKRFSFANLHKALEGIKGAVEVPRKAKHAAEAVIKVLQNPETYEISKFNVENYDKFTIKREKFSNDNLLQRFRKLWLFGKKNNTGERIKVNLINVALEAANKSTSSPQLLFTTLVFSLLLASALVLRNFYSSKDSEEEEGEADADEECGAH